jgi:hypothetical protein
MNPNELIASQLIIKCSSLRMTSVFKWITWSKDCLAGCILKLYFKIIYFANGQVFL